MTAETIVRPRLQHFGIATANLDEMIDWYGKVLGMTVNHRTAPPPEGAPQPFFQAAFLSNDEVHHRIAMLNFAGVQADADRRRHARVQHVAFEYDSIDDLLSSYSRLKRLGILPVMAADEGIQTVLYYEDPDGNAVELNVNNYGDERAATEHIKRGAGDGPRRMLIDVEQLVAAHRGGAILWELHERAFAGEFASSAAPDPRRLA